MSRQRPGQQSHGRSAIARVERLSRRFPARQSLSVDDYAIALFFDLDAQAAQAIERAPAVCRRGKIGDFASPLRKRCHDCIPVRDGFIAGHHQHAAERLRWMNSLLRHAEIVARRFETTPGPAPVSNRVRMHQRENEHPARRYRDITVAQRALLRATARVIMKSLMRLRPGFWLAALLFVFLALPAVAQENPAIFPLADVTPGMKGIAYTIFSGDQIEKLDVTVLGILKNAMGPQQDIILVELAGADVAKTGVVAGMSGSPVYFDGKLAGAISLKIGLFSKDPIAGVTPIQNMLDIEKSMAQPATQAVANPSPQAASDLAIPSMSPAPATDENTTRVPLGGGQFLIPIETPLIFSGVLPQALSRFSSNFQALGMSAMAGGTVPPSPEDAQVQPGDMVGMDLVSGDISVAAGCTVTAIIRGRVFVCGHPFNGLGSVALPMTRAYVVTTLASSLESTKIMNTGGVIGTFQQDTTTGVVGQLGGGPPTIPVEINLTTSTQQRHFHFRVVENPKLTPLLVAMVAYNGVLSNTAYSEGTTLEMNGEISLEGHPSVDLRDMFVPSDTGMPDAFQIAATVEAAFGIIYGNPYEQPKVSKVTVNVDSLSSSRWSQIEGAWSDKSEVSPGDNLNIKVLLRPYRGEPFLREIPVTVPPQASQGNLQILVSDASSLNRMRELFGGAAQNRLRDLDELIRVINRERQNDCLYVTLLQNTPTLLVEDKELPDVPASEINVLDQRRAPGGAQLLYQSVIGEHSVPMNQVIAGQQYLSITVK